MYIIDFIKDYFKSSKETITAEDLRLSQKYGVKTTKAKLVQEILDSIKTKIQSSQTLNPNNHIIQELYDEIDFKDLENYTACLLDKGFQVKQIEELGIKIYLVKWQQIII